MPEIKNEYYKSFKENKLMIEEITEEQFNEWLDEIPQQKLPRKCSPDQARAIFIILFFTGRRPSEIVDLKAKDIIKISKGFRRFQLNIKTLKGGKQDPIVLPPNKYIKEAYTFMKKFPAEMYCFYAFRKNNKNTVKITKEETIIIQELQPDGTIIENETIRVAQTSKIYRRKGDLLRYYCTLWTDRPPYYFRHYRYSDMIAKGATEEEVKAFKGGRSKRSVEQYLHASPRLAKKTIKTINF